MILLNQQQIDRIKKLVHDYSGILLERVATRQVERKIGQQMKRYGIVRFDDYCTVLSGSSHKNNVMDGLLAELTVNESFFFRNPGQFEFLYESYIPDLLASRSRSKPVSIWSAGCARGEEAYSIAMVASYFQHKMLGSLFRINAGDINNKNIRKAVEGHFNERSLRHNLEKYELELAISLGVRDENGGCIVADDLKKLVRFSHLNLKYQQGLKCLAGSDIIFCRNVLIYFDEEFRRKLVDHFWRYLNPGGILLLGESECMPKESKGFELISYKKAYAYKKISGKTST